ESYWTYDEKWDRGVKQGEAISNAKITMSKERFNVECSRFKREYAPDGIQNLCVPAPLHENSIQHPGSEVPDSSLRATSESETREIPKYFPNYFKTVQISRVSFKDPKDGKMCSSTFPTFDKHRGIMKKVSASCETGSRSLFDNLI
ncbi:MAG TPA: hypothetical protein VLA12_12760, partial [Planctomycetaceae bacterium]|nr:hypothetical protein [Planctomycetaceae bacterium]